MAICPSRFEPDNVTQKRGGLERDVVSPVTASSNQTVANQIVDHGMSPGLLRLRIARVAEPVAGIQQPLCALQHAEQAVRHTRHGGLVLGAL